MSSPGWIELHDHVLAGIDDGPKDMAGAVALLRAMVADGTATVVATPHVLPERYPTSPEQRDEALERLRGAAAAAGLPIAIEPGGELDLEYAAGASDEELGAFGLAGSRALLLEFPWVGGWPPLLAPLAFDLATRGWLPIVAHPERMEPVQRDPARLDAVVGTGAICQVTAGSVAGRFGGTAQRVAFELFRSGRAHVVASDAHSHERRRPAMTDAYAALAKEFGEAFADAVMHEAPAELLAGRAPELPEPRAKRRLGFFGR